MFSVLYSTVLYHAFGRNANLFIFYFVKMHICRKLVEELGGEVVKMIFLIELTDLGGRKLLEGYDVASVVQYEGE